MPATWLYMVAGIVIASMALVIAYNFIGRVIDFSQRENSLSNFNTLRNNLENVCVQEYKNFVKMQFSITPQVRVVYTTVDIENPILKVTDKISNQEKSYGNYLCLQFKDEPDKLRCEKISCDASLPYMGALADYEDFWQGVNKILGRANVRNYDLTISKLAASVRVTVG